jgi:putative ABC transport system ATP-binding protein
MLEVKNLTKSFAETGTLFENANLKLSPGEIVFLKGKSGSGKSQFLKAIISLTPVEKGQIYFNGKESTEDNLPYLRSKIHFVSQNFPTQTGSVRDYLSEPFKLKIYKDKKPILDMEESFLNKRVSLLSGGERQMVHLKRSLSLKPDILLLDEPTSAMDPATKEKAHALIKKFLEDGGAVIWVTHDGPPMDGKVINFPEF